MALVKMWIGAGIYVLYSQYKRPRAPAYRLNLVNRQATLTVQTRFIRFVLWVGHSPITARPTSGHGPLKARSGSAQGRLVVRENILCPYRNAPVRDYVGP